MRPLLTHPASAKRRSSGILRKPDIVSCTAVSVSVYSRCSEARCDHTSYSVAQSLALAVAFDLFIPLCQTSGFFNTAPPTAPSSPPPIPFSPPLPHPSPHATLRKRLTGSVIGQHHTKRSSFKPINSRETREREGGGGQCARDGCVGRGGGLGGGGEA